MSLDILKNEDALPNPESNGTGKGLDSIQPVPNRPGRGGARPGSGRKPSQARPVEVVPTGPPPELFKPEDVLPAIELPFKLAAVALRSDAVDLETDEKARLGRTGANAANYWLAVSPKAFTGIIFLTTMTQVLLAKVILFKAEERSRLEAAAKDAQPTKTS